MCDESTDRDRIFVARADGTFICETCLASHPEIDISLDATQVWLEHSEGWLESLECHDCKSDIPVYIGTGEAAT